MSGAPAGHPCASAFGWPCRLVACIHSLVRITTATALGSAPSRPGARSIRPPGADTASCRVGSPGYRPARQCADGLPPGAVRHDAESVRAITYRERKSAERTDNPLRRAKASPPSVHSLVPGMNRCGGVTWWALLRGGRGPEQRNTGHRSQGPGGPPSGDLSNCARNLSVADRVFSLTHQFFWTTRTPLLTYRRRGDRQRQPPLYRLNVSVGSR